MPVIKQTMFFQFSGSPACGFSESWTYQGTLAQSPTVLNNLILRRVEVLSQSWTITGGRSAVLTPKNKTTPSNHCIIAEQMVQPLVCPVGQVGKLGKADTPWTALLISLFKKPTGSSTTDLFNAGKPRQEQLRGIPDSWWTDAALSIPPLDLVALNTFMGLIVGTTPGFGQYKLEVTASPPDDCTASFNRYSNWCIRRISSRRIGRPFGLLAGQRRRVST